MSVSELKVKIQLESACLYVSWYLLLSWEFKCYLFCRMNVVRVCFLLRNCKQSQPLLRCFTEVEHSWA